MVFCSSLRIDGICHSGARDREQLMRPVSLDGERVCFLFTESGCPGVGSVFVLRWCKSSCQNTGAFRIQKKALGFVCSVARPCCQCPWLVAVTDT
jgi:hypothetical protein